MIIKVENWVEYNTFTVFVEVDALSFKFIAIVLCGCTKFLAPMGRVPIREKVEYRPD